MSGRSVLRVLAMLAVSLLTMTAAAGPASAKVVTGDGGDDFLLGSNKGDEISGVDGNDQLYGRKRADVLEGGADRDLLAGSSGADTLDGGLDEDQVLDDDGRDGDTLEGGEDDDALVSADGAADSVDCGNASDTAIVDDGDTLIGDSCEQVIEADGFYLTNIGTLDVTFGTNSKDVIDVSATVADQEFAVGRKGNDTLNGSSEDDVLVGGSGEDKLFGNDGEDNLLDDDGKPDDKLFAGGGDDFVVSADGAADRVDCGDDDDMAIVDKSDKVTNCETVIEETAVELP